MSDITIHKFRPSGAAPDASRKVESDQPITLGGKVLSFLKNIFLTDKPVTPIAKPAHKKPAAETRPNPSQPAPSARSAEPTPADLTVISGDTVIEGKITSASNLEIYGVINGDVSAKGNISIFGSITGNVDGASIQLQHCSVQGHLTAEDFIRIDSESAVMGNVRALELISDGKIKGDLYLSKSARLQENSLVIGNLTSYSLAIEMGAVLYGEVKIQQNGAVSPAEAAELKPEAEEDAKESPTQIAVN